MDRNRFEDLVHHLFFSTSRVEFRSLSDKQLLQRYTDYHNELALGEVVRRHKILVWAICQRILGRCQEAEDVYQVTFLKLIRQAIFLRRYESVAGWLHAAAHHMASNAKRMSDRQCACEKRRAEMFEEGDIDPRDNEDLTDIVNKEVGSLAEKCRSPIILCYLEGLTHEQAARRIKISTNCLQRRLAEGRKRLHQRLSKRGINLDASMLVAELTVYQHTQQVPPKLMEKTLHMVRILTQSNSALEPAAISSGTTVLAKSAIEAWTFKSKLLIAFVLATLVIMGGCMITLSGWWNIRGRHLREDRPTPVKKATEMPVCPQ